MNNVKVKNKTDLEIFACSNWDKINSYLDSISNGLPIPIYSSVDIRESTQKYAPVDHNLFPAGFNNLCSLDLIKSSHFFKTFIQQNSLNSNFIGIIPESNTKNTFYLDHLHILSSCFKNLSKDVFFLSFDESLFQESNDNSIKLISNSGYNIEIYRAQIENRQLFIQKSENRFFLDFVILNHDQSTPMNIDWKSISTPIFPTPLIGWYQREKAKHFYYYEKILNEFCTHFSIEPELMMAKFKLIENIDFASKEGLDRIAKAVDKLKEEIPSQAKVFVKANKGTYGMGIEVVNSGDEILHMNRKTRNKMDIGKNQIKFTSVLVQEGIETAITYDHSPAEVVVYLVNGRSTGGFMRSNPLRDTQSNLNARGMVFQKLCMSEIGQNHEHKCKEAIYSIIARLSTIASSYEIKEVQQGTSFYKN